jgi:peroxiredoxin Q/BCP
VSFDTPAANKKFAEKHNFNFPLLCDTDRKMGIAYGATARGETGGAKRIGVVIGPDGRIKEWLPKVDPASYPAQVLARI